MYLLRKEVGCTRVVSLSLLQGKAHRVHDRKKYERRKERAAS